MAALHGSRSQLRGSVLTDGLDPVELRARRRALGLTQHALAELLCVAPNTVARWERGELRMTHPSRVRSELARLEADAGAKDSADAWQPHRRQHNLPAPHTRLIGREHDSASVRDLVLQAPGRIVTLAGTGGCGKTRLALKVAAELVDTFSDGAWLVELAPLADPSLVPQTVATVLRVREQAGRPILDTLAARLKSRQLLLVLDNCEHLVEACARLVEHVLRACPTVRLVATSREPLRVAGEAVFPVLPLPVPKRSPLAEPEHLARNAAVQLFVERAQAAQPSFRLTDETAGPVAEIAVRLDGLPLAIELAAARVRALGVEQILERLDDSFQLLVGGSRTALDRQQTLAATLDWSHKLLTEPEQIVFRRLAVFAGDWSLEAVEAVCGGAEVGDVLEVLTRLVDKSLVVVVERGGRVRYRLLAPVRQYASVRLAGSGELPRLQEAHARWCLAFAEGLGPEAKWEGPPRRAALDGLEGEHENLRAALRWTISGTQSELALRLAEVLSWFWFQRGHYLEGHRWLAEVLALPGCDVRTSARASVATAAGFVAYEVAELPSAQALFEEGLAIAREIGDRWVEASALDGLANAARALGDAEISRGLLEESVAVSRTSGDRFLEAIALHNLARLANSQADYTQARARGQAAHALGRALGDEWLLQLTLLDLGLAAHGLGEHALAQSQLEQALALARALGDVARVTDALDALGYLALDRGHPAQTRARFAESLRVRQEAGERGGLAESLECASTLAAMQAAPMRALQLAGAAAALRDAIAVPQPPRIRLLVQRWLSSASARMSPEARARAWEAGQALLLEPALALAQSVLRSRSAEAPRARTESPRQPGPLTRREYEVVLLLANGLSNREMAQRLVVTERTIAAHIEHILDKLGARSRTQVAAWAAQHGLLATQPT